MTDRKFSDVAPRYAAWEIRDQHIEELRRELAEEREVIGSIARERDALREECADLHATNEALRARLSAALERERRERRAQRRLRRNDWRGTLVLAWYRLTGRK